MPITAPDIKIELFLNDARTSYFLEDTTGAYSLENPLGYGVPTVTTASVDTVVVTFNYTLLSTTIVYTFTVSSGTITSCLMSFAGAAAVEIVSALTSTSWPFTSANRFELTNGYSEFTLPQLTDQVVEVTYQVAGTYTAEEFDYTVEEPDLYDVQATCCVSKALIDTDINNLTGQENSMIASGWMVTAHSALEQGLTDKANTYITKALAICESNPGGCGCS